MKPALLLLLSFASVVAACTGDAGESSVSPPAGAEVPAGAVDAESGGIRTLSDGTKYLIHPSEIVSGGPPKDGIPSIDNPEFISVDEADGWLEDDEFGAAIIHDGVERFYPFQILVFHEIVNDDIAGSPVLVTYCPLCGSVIGYERTLDGEPVEFGTSGKLYNSNLVMYDRKTDTYWTQIEGRAVVGPLTGQELELFPVDVVTWGDWKSAYSDSEVLGRETGHVRPYGSDPYGGYYTSPNTIFPVGGQDERLHPKAVVFGVVANGTPKAYAESQLQKGDSFEDEIGSIPVSVSRDEVGIVTIASKETGERIPHEREFWFAWFAFHPDTLLYGG